MAGWNDLPKELKWLIFKCLIVQIPQYANQSHYLRKSYVSLPNIFFPKNMLMNHLFTLLSLIDKQTRNLLQSKTLFKRELCCGKVFYIF